MSELFMLTTLLNDLANKHNALFDRVRKIKEEGEAAPALYNMILRDAEAVRTHNADIEAKLENAKRTQVGLHKSIARFQKEAEDARKDASNWAAQTAQLSADLAIVSSERHGASFLMKGMQDEIDSLKKERDELAAQVQAVSGYAQHLEDARGDSLIPKSEYLKIKKERDELVVQIITLTPIMPAWDRRRSQRRVQVDAGAFSGPFRRTYKERRKSK